MSDPLQPAPGSCSCISLLPLVLLTVAAAAGWWLGSWWGLLFGVTAVVAVCFGLYLLAR